MFDADGTRWSVVPFLAAQLSPQVDLPCQVGGTYRLPARLLAVRVPQAVADERRRKLRATARRKQVAPSAASLALADWTVFITTVPPARLSLDEALVLGRARWQIERRFKLWKSQGRIDESWSGTPWRVLCEVYAKLVAMVVQHWLLLVECWRYPNRSLPKAGQTVQKQAWQLTRACGCQRGLIQAIMTIEHCLAGGVG